VVSDEILRRAIFEARTGETAPFPPFHQRGVLIDAEALLASLRRHGAALSAEELDALMRARGAERLDYPIAQALRRLLRLGRRRPAYTMDMYSWQKLRRRRGAG
jgi:hypothetical protein